MSNPVNPSTSINSLNKSHKRSVVASLIIIALYTIFVVPIFQVIHTKQPVVIYPLLPYYVSIGLISLIILYLSPINNQKIQEHAINNTWHTIDYPLHQSIVISAFALYFIGICYSLLSCYYSLAVNQYDFGIFREVVNAVSHGDLSGYNPTENLPHLYVHQSYIMWIYGLIYKILGAQAWILQILDAIRITTTGWLIYRISRFRLSQLASLLIVFIYFISPFNFTAYNFSVESCASVLVCALYYFYLRGKFHWFVIIVILLAMVKEDAVLYLLGASLYFLIKKEWRFAITAISVAITFLFINNFITIPLLSNNTQAHFATLGIFSQLGTTPEAIITNLLSNPFIVFHRMFDKFSGIWTLYGTFAFIPLFNPFTLLSSIFEIVLLALANTDSGLHQYTHYYAISINALMFVGMAVVVGWIHSKNSKLAFVIILLFLISFCPHSNIAGRFQRYFYVDASRLYQLNQAINEIKIHYPNQPIYTSNNLIPHMIGSGIHYKVLDVSHLQPGVYFIAFNGDTWPYNTPQLYQLATRLKNCQSIGNTFILCNNRTTHD